MSIAYQTPGAIAYSAQNGTSVAPAYPASIAAGDMLILIIGMKPSTANSGSVTTPAGWTPVTSITGAGGYGSTLGADTGNTNLFVFSTKADGTESGSLTVTVATNNVCWAQMLRLANDTKYWGIVAGTGSDISGDTTWDAVCSAIAIAANDFVIGALCIPTDVTTPAQFSTQNLIQTGTTFGTRVEISEPDSGTGNDIGGMLCYAFAQSGSGTGTVTFQSSVAGTVTNVRGPGVIIRVRETAAPSFTQSAFRLRNDDGSESTATWKATANQNASINVDENFRCRFVVQETAGTPLSSVGFKFESRLNAGSWTAITGTSSTVISSLSSNFTDGVDCVQRVGSGTFISDNNGMDENGAVAELIDYAGSTETEIEGCFQIVAADVNNGDTVQLRAVRYDSSVLNGYTNTPSVTVVKQTAFQEDLTSVGVSSASVVDAKVVLEDLLSVITSSASVEDAKQAIEAVQTTIASQTQLADQQAYIDALETVIVSSATVQDAIAFVELLQTTVSSTASVSDAQAFLEAVATTAVSISESVDRQIYLDTITTTVVSAASVDDAKVYVEAMTTVITSQASVDDAVVLAEMLTSTGTSLASVDDRQYFFENVTALAQSQASAADLQTFIESVQSSAAGLGTVVDMMEGQEPHVFGATVAARVFEAVIPAREFEATVYQRTFETTVPA